MPFEGFESAIKAFGTGGITEAAGAQNENARLVRARDALARMDSNVAKAIINTQKANQRGALETDFGADISPAERAILGELGSDFLSGRKAEGVEQQNTARGFALDNLTNGADPDAQNALIAIAEGKLLGTGNVSVRDQAGADIDAALGRGKASRASAESSKATAGYNRSRTAGVDGTNTAFSSMSAPEIALNFGTSPEAQSEYNKFLAWKTVKSRTDPKYRNVDYALGEYRVLNQAEAPVSDPLGDNSQINPHIAVPGEAKPPTGTWVKLPDGRIIQAP